MGNISKGNISAAPLVQAMVRVVNRIFNGVYAETSQGATSLGATSLGQHLKGASSLLHF
jgi:hypothetical protein